MPDNSSLEALLARALAAEIGLIVECDNMDRFKARLYEARKADPDFAQLSFVISPTNPETQLWIVKRNVRPAETHAKPTGG